MIDTRSKKKSPCAAGRFLFAFRIEKEVLNNRILYLSFYDINIRIHIYIQYLKIYSSNNVNLKSIVRADCNLKTKQQMDMI